MAETSLHFHEHQQGNMALALPPLPIHPRIVLAPVRWETYQALLQDVTDHSHVRMTYDQGTLELMAPSYAHEETNRILAMIVEAIALGQGRDLQPAGSTTFTSAQLARGFEPDSCYYFTHAATVRGQAIIDLALDPPPELVIEVDMTRASLNKLPLYAAVGVGEVWRYDGTHVLIYTLAGTRYTAVPASTVLAPITSQQLTTWLRQQRELPYPAWVQMMQAQIRSR
ncbi:MAG: Uma2 family endonuclease [Candidatus Tectomicrobia bacterium]|uniref:Uma2 family endonuclease n=1 Tax=Tectimicrobiota bacterium TaxID=2528274 RepID=A0A937W7T4_UNCTE|nr:Uma2 family endonuclease [Candidatus Tectomicrobia bacterium]